MSNHPTERDLVDIREEWSVKAPRAGWVGRGSVSDEERRYAGGLWLLLADARK
jgi:hypothetical protein